MLHHTGCIKCTSCIRSTRFVLALLAAAAIAARTTTGDSPIEYRLDLTAPAERSMGVEMRVSGIAGPLDVRMSRSSPGRYALHEFAKNIYDVTADDGSGRALTVTHEEPNRWVVAGHDGTVRFRYRVYGDRLDGTYLAIDPSHAHINAPAAFAWAAGHVLRPVRVTIEPPPASGWRVATQLFPTSDPLSWAAPNLQYLMDSPLEVSRFLDRVFEADLPVSASASRRPRVEVALHHHRGDAADLDLLVDRLRRIVKTEAAVFGEYPDYDDGRYTFLIDIIPWASADGMEHRNSTVVTAARADGVPFEVVETAAHEFFHGWNVERIRPRTLEPFDFERANTSGELWLAEGFTSYYEDLALVRAGITSLDQTLRSFASALNIVLSSPAIRMRSAEEMSRLAPLVDGAQAVDRTNIPSTFVSYYTHGEVLALGFDLAIREHTAGRRSLDDFMRAMWRTHGRPGGTRAGYVDAPYSIDDVRSRLAEVTDRAFADGLVARYVEGRETMDYPRLLARAGLLLRSGRTGAAALPGVTLQPAGGRLRVATAPVVGSPLFRAGLGQDDEIVSVNGRDVRDAEALERAIGRLPPGASVVIRFVRRGEQREQEATVTMAEEPWLELVPVERTRTPLDSAQREFRRAWLAPSN